MTRHTLRPQSQGADRHAEAGSATPPEASSHVRKRLRNTTDDDENPLCPQQRYVKPPKHPGMATFDSGLRQLPLQRPSRYEPPPQLPMESYKEQLMLLEIQCRRGCERAKTRHRMDDLKMLLDDNNIDRGAQSVESPDSGRVFTMEQLNAALLTPSSSQDSGDGHNSLETAVQDTPTFAMSLYFLEIETKLIYLDLVNTKHPSAKSNPNAAPSFEAPDTPTWQKLAGLRAALLRPEHDFMTITQDHTSLESVRRLAVKYGSPSEHSRIRTKIFIDSLKSAPRQLQEQLVAFAQTANNFLEKFEPSYPDILRGDLKLMSAYIHAYLKEILDAEVLESCNYHYGKIYPTDSSTGVVSPNCEHRPRELDDWLRARYLRDFEAPPLVPAPEVDALYQTTLPLKESVLCLLLGWLCVGPLMAETFHDFCLVFKFLAWYGAGY